MQDKLVIHGARAHNLKNIDVEIPRDKLVVVTGLSGSGKSSLAFDTIYAEGQRRYVESLSAYARQFLGNMEKPDVDSIDGLSPAISIDQKTTSKNPRSTVGTATEINDYLRLLYARVGVPYCPNGHGAIQSSSVEQIVDEVLALPERTRMQILAPIVRRRKGQHKAVFDRVQKDGYVRVRVDGEIYDVTEVPELSKSKMHNIEVVVDRLVNKDGIRSRLFDSVEAALRLADGYLIVDTMDDNELLYSEHYSCPVCGFTVPELEPRLFSFNAPFGSCPTCDGLGNKLEVDMDLVIPDASKTLREGALAPWNPISSNYYPAMLEQAMEQFGVDMDTPFEDLKKEEQDLILYGSGDREFHFHYVNDFGGVRDIDIPFEGVVTNINRRYHETNSDFTRNVMRGYMNELSCPTCHGYRLNEAALSVRVGGENGLNIGQISDLSISDHLKEIDNLELGENEGVIARPIVKEIKDRLTFLNNVGLNYLTLSRMAGTLSGGESQRINLATSLGSSLVGSLYILDEPSIGLHSRDTDKLIHVLRQLQQLGNTVVIVEHDEEIIRAADYIIDIGPKAGRLGGQIVYQGDMKDLQPNSDSYTVRYLLGEEEIPVPEHRRPWNNYIELTGARENNLKGVDVRFPLNVMTVVTGVSGSGKSTLVRDIFFRALKRELDECSERPGEFASIGGDLQNLRNVEFVDQNPIGKSSRSNPVTYIKAYDEIRKLWAEQPLAKQMGYTAGYFSFNSEGGRCEECKGDGTITVEMQFMADLVLECETCHGKRFKADTLEVKFHDANIYDVLEMTVNQAVEFFNKHGQKKIVKKLAPLQDVGLGYIKLGQSSSTLSGGENQRVKLAYYLSQEKADPTLFIFDEPTTGLHFHDIRKLLEAFDALILRGHSIVIIEHNMDVIKCADYVIDLGPEGGDKGGNLVAAGTPEEVAKCATSYTGQFLQEKLHMK